MSEEARPSLRAALPPDAAMSMCDEIIYAVRLTAMNPDLSYEERALEIERLTRPYVDNLLNNPASWRDWSSI